MLETIKTNHILYKEIAAENATTYECLKTEVNRNSGKNEWSFCLGAGVSLSCGLPDWSSLLFSMLKDIIRSYPILPSKRPGENNTLIDILNDIESSEWKDTFVSRLNDKKSHNIGIDLLEMAEYIRNEVGELIEFGLKDADPSLAEKQLRDHVGNSFKVIIKKNAESFSDSIKGTTLSAVAEVMSKLGIFTAMTYNYDNLLEIALRSKENEISKTKKGYIKKTVRSILPEDGIKFENDGEGYSIYHCHGRIPVKLQKGTPKSVENEFDEWNTEKPSDRIILSETSYYQEESKHYSLSNVLQSYAMDYGRMIYVGFSGTDYTFKRIVKEMPHYT